jgi:hypothetical protein
LARKADPFLLDGTKNLALYTAVERSAESLEHASTVAVITEEMLTRLNDPTRYIKIKEVTRARIILTWSLLYDQNQAKKDCFPEQLRRVRKIGHHARVCGSKNVALAVAARVGATRACKNLLEDRADPTAMIDKTHSVLDVAVESGAVEVVRLLVTSKAELSQYKPKGHTPCKHNSLKDQILDKNEGRVLEALLVACPADQECIGTPAGLSSALKEACEEKNAPAYPFDVV